MGNMQERIDAVRQKLEDEISEAAHELEVDLPVRIDEARSKGDLSENAEYESAKERQRYLVVRLFQLQHRSAKLSDIDLSKVDTKTIGLYSVVTLTEVESKKTTSYELVLPEEMDVKKGMISIMSPIGQHLRGKSVGKKVTMKTPARTFDIIVNSFTNILGEEFKAK